MMFSASLPRPPETLISSDRSVFSLATVSFSVRISPNHLFGAWGFYLSAKGKNLPVCGKYFPNPEKL
jgi:hypothetical protein